MLGDASIFYVNRAGELVKFDGAAQLGVEDFVEQFLRAKAPTAEIFGVFENELPSLLGELEEQKRELAEVGGDAGASNSISALKGLGRRRLPVGEGRLVAGPRGFG